ncbi:hypothetical protein ACOSQ2_018849 [Xanthoceras sorbifolium]
MHHCCGETKPHVAGHPYDMVLLGHAGKLWHSKMKHEKNTENDRIMQEIVTMLSFDESDQGWAVICRGSKMAKAKSETILKCFGDYNLWKSLANQKGFIPAIIDHDLQGLYNPNHCNRLILPVTTRSIPQRIVCSKCGKPMKKFIMYCYYID